MPGLTKLSRTDVSAIVSVILFSMTILISAVGPADAGPISSINTSSPTVMQTSNGYPA